MNLSAQIYRSGNLILDDFFRYQSSAKLAILPQKTILESSVAHLLNFQNIMCNMYLDTVINR